MGSTISAIASPPGPGERGVIRLSGPAAREVARECCTLSGEPVQLAGRGLLQGRLHDGRGEQPCLLLWMPGPRSYTGEDVLELHLPGSPPLLEAAFARVLRVPGIELAGPGEFTRRAFLSGRMDLSRAEGVLELTLARSREERRAATALLVGGLEERTSDLRDRLDTLRALCEASLDFDEGDAIDVPVAELEALAAELARRLDDALQWEEQRGRDAGLPRVVLLGRPNAGKSSLFNRLVGAEGQRALVSDHAGTTRDTLRASCELGGRRVELVDVAGLDGTSTGLDGMAQELALRERGAADLLLWVVDGSGEDVGGPAGDLHGEGQPGGSGAEPSEPGGGAPVLHVWNKCDLAGQSPSGWLAVSALDGRGLEGLGAAVAEALDVAVGEGSRRTLAARHLHGLKEARSALEVARGALSASLPLDLVAEHLREATSALDGIAGRTTPEDLLDRIFARFCLGK